MGKSTVTLAKVAPAAVTANPDALQLAPASLEAAPQAPASAEPAPASAEPAPQALTSAASVPAELLAQALALLANLGLRAVPASAEQAPAPRAPSAKADDSDYPASPKAFPGGIPLTTVIVRVKPNPKKPGSASYARYARYPQAPFTLAEVLKVAGGPTTADFLWDIRKGFIQTK